MPPVSFTAEEAVSLLMGADFIEQRLDTEYAMEAKSAQRKIEAILPESVRNESTRVRETMRLLHTVEPLTRARVKTYLNQIRNAILDQRKISFMYLKKCRERMAIGITCVRFLHMASHLFRRIGC